MRSDRHVSDYEAVLPSRQSATREHTPVTPAASSSWGSEQTHDVANERPAPAETSTTTVATRPRRRGHALTYACLFLFTIVLYARPSDFYPSAFTNSLAFYLGVITLAVFVPAQFISDGTFSIFPREVKLALLLCLTALLSIPFAKVSQTEAWDTFSDVFIRAIVMFVVIVNVVRTERRLKGMLLLALGVGAVLSLISLNNYRLGNFTVEGYRVTGGIGGMFGNPNDMAIHLVTMVPIAVTLFFRTRGLLRRALYGACAALLTAGIAVTFSRGGFLALVVVVGVLVWKLGRKHRFAALALLCVALLGFLVLAPGGYSDRILSIFDRSRDAFGSGDARQALLLRSLQVALRNPLFGVGMGNFHYVSIRELVSHNAYTQVAAEMGVAALVIYTLFIITPLRHLRRIERETFAARQSGSRFYYLAVGLQASLIGYMVASFFASVAYYWYVYYLVAYAVSLRYLYDAATCAR